MSRTIVEVDEFTTDVTVPEDGDPRNVASIDPAWQALSNRTRNSKNRLDSLLGGEQSFSTGTNMDQLAPDPGVRMIRFGPSSDGVEIRGILRQSGAKFLELVSTATANRFVLKHEHASANAEDRFVCPGGLDFEVQARDGVALAYDELSSRWRIIGRRFRSNQGFDLAGNAEVNYSPPRSVTRPVDLKILSKDSFAPNSSNAPRGVDLATESGEYYVPLDVVPDGAVITAVAIGLTKSSTAASLVQLAVWTVDQDASPGYGTMDTSVGDSQSGSAGAIHHEETGLSEAVDLATKRYYIKVTATEDADVSPDTLTMACATFNHPGPR